jgi:hypothetical protein
MVNVLEKDGQASFEALVTQYEQPLLRFLCGLVHDPELAADLCQAQRLWVVVGTGQVQEIDLARRVVTRTANLAGDPLRCAPSCVPGQRLHVTADGTRLFVRAAPGQPELRSRGFGTVVWVVDTATLTVVAEVPLRAPAFDSAPTPDGRTLVTSNTSWQDPSDRATRLVEIPTGREVSRWPGGVNGMHTQPPASAPSATTPGQPSTPATAGVPTGRTASGRRGRLVKDPDPTRRPVARS